MDDCVLAMTLVVFGCVGCVVRFCAVQLRFGCVAVTSFRLCCDGRVLAAWLYSRCCGVVTAVCCCDRVLCWLGVDYVGWL